MTRLAPALLLLAASPALADWPVFRGSPEMAGVGVAKLPDQLAEKWAFKTGNAIEGAPVVAAGVVYVASADKHLYAVDLATGKEKWRAKLAAPTKASPAVRGDRVYVGDADGEVGAFSAKTGERLWTYKAPGEVNSGCNFYKDTILVGSYDGTLTALAADGKKVWEYKIDMPVNGSPAVAGDRTFLAGCDSILHVIDTTTGKPVSTIDIAGQSGATAAVGGDVVYVGTMSNQLVAVDVKAGKKRWTFDSVRHQPFYSSAAVAGDLVYAGCRDKRLYAVDAKTGKSRWSFVTEGMVDGSPVVVGSRVYFGCLSSDDDKPNFFVLDAGSGAKVQQFTLDSAVTGSPAVAGDGILIGTEKGTLYYLGAK